VLGGHGGQLSPFPPLCLARRHSRFRKTDPFPQVLPGCLQKPGAYSQISRHMIYLNILVNCCVFIPWLCPSACDTRSWECQQWPISQALQCLSHREAGQRHTERSWDNTTTLQLLMGKTSIPVPCFEQRQQEVLLPHIPVRVRPFCEKSVFG